MPLGRSFPRLPLPRPQENKYGHLLYYLRYIVNPARLKEFEHYGKLWIPLVENSAAAITAISCRRKA
jgi:hypothetical protein